jgi:hypothetical protein
VLSEQSPRIVPLLLGETPAYLRPARLTFALLEILPAIRNSDQGETWPQALLFRQEVCHEPIRSPISRDWSGNGSFRATVTSIRMAGVGAKRKLARHASSTYSRGDHHRGHQPLSRRPSWAHLLVGPARGKRLQLLNEAVPSARRITALLYGVDEPLRAGRTQELQTTAAALNLELQSCSERPG